MKGSSTWYAMASLPSAATAIIAVLPCSSAMRARIRSIPGVVAATPPASGSCTRGARRSHRRGVRAAPASSPAGLPEGAASVRMARQIARRMKDEATLVLDAAALGAAGTRARCIITPHSGEMAQLLEVERADVDDDPEAAARTASERFGGVCVLKGPRTFVASNEAMFLFDDGSPGLGTSGFQLLHATCFV